MSDADIPSAPPHGGDPPELPLESRAAAWLQALFVRDTDGSRTHLLCMLHHAAPKSPDDGEPGVRTGRPEAYARDLALVRRAAADDPYAAQELADRLACVPAMARSRHRKLGSPLSEDELTDVVQDVLVRLLSKLERFEGRSSLETWAYGFVVRELYKGFDRLRRRARRVEWSDERLGEVAEEPDPGAQEEYRIVHEKLHAIGPPGSDIIRLKHFELLTFEEIAEELEMPLGTVKTRYYRSADRLRAMLRRFWRERSR